VIHILRYLRQRQCSPSYVYFKLIHHIKIHPKNKIHKEYSSINNVFVNISFILKTWTEYSSIIQTHFSALRPYNSFKPNVHVPNTPHLYITAKSPSNSLFTPRLKAVSQLHRHITQTPVPIIMTSKLSQNLHSSPTHISLRTLTQKSSKNQAKIKQKFH